MAVIVKEDVVTVVHIEGDEQEEQEGRIWASQVRHYLSPHKIFPFLSRSTSLWALKYFGNMQPAASTE